MGAHLRPRFRLLPDRHACRRTLTGMQQPSPPPASATATGESVTRPEPGIARGVWEAPAWVFWVMLAVIVLGGIGYLLHRLGMLRLPGAQKSNGNRAS